MTNYRLEELISDPDKAVTCLTTEAAALERQGVAENVDFYNGEHFKDGKYWTGPQPADPNDPAAIDKIRVEFASKNPTRESTDGHRDGVIAREPEWAFTVKRALAKKGDVVGDKVLEEDEKPNADEQARIREVQAALTNWWNERRVLKTLREAAKDLLLAERVVLRLYIPEGELTATDAQGNRAVPRGTLEESLNRIYLLNHKYNEAIVVTDKRKMRDVGIFVDDSDEEATLVEVTFLEPDKRTSVRVFKKDKKGKAATPYTPSSSYQSVFSTEVQDSSASEGAQTFTADLGGRLAMFQMAREPFVTPQMIQSNKSLNKGKTLRGHTLTTSGFPETALLNGQLAGTLEPDSTREGGYRFIADPVERGASVFNAWTGIKYKNAQGDETYSPVSVWQKEPSPVSVFIESERADYADIMEESGQAHRLIAGDATASALSRIQAKGTFGTSLLPTKGELDSAVRWILETVLAYGALFSNQADRYADLRANADCRIDTGPVLPDEVRVWLELVDKKIWSRARLQRMTGIEDAEAEDAVILADDEKFNSRPVVQAAPPNEDSEADDGAPPPPSPPPVEETSGAVS